MMTRSTKRICWREKPWWRTGDILYMFRKLLSNIFHGVINTLSDYSSLLFSKIGLEPIIITTPYAALKQWESKTLQAKRAGGAKRIAIMAIRNGTWVEWAVFAAHKIYNMGYQPVVIYDEGDVKNIYFPNKVSPTGINFWKEFLSLDYIEKYDLNLYFESEDKKEITASYLDFVGEYAHTVAAYNLRVEEYESHVMVEDYKKEYGNAQNMLMTAAVALNNLLKNIQIDTFLCPSGLIDQSAAALEVTKRLNIRSIFIEGWAMRPGHLIWAFNRPALDYDVEGWMKVLGEWNSEKEKDSNDFKKFQERLSLTRDDEWLENFHPVQRRTKQDKYSRELEEFLMRPGTLFLCGTNVVGDSATLRRATIYKNQKEWLSGLVDYFKNHPEYRLLIRAHPDEAWQKAKVKIGDYVAELKKGINNIYVIKGDEDINTYSLAERADIGLAWLSNIGVDMVIRGKPVIMAANPKYGNLNIVEIPKTREEYFRKIEQMAANPTPPSKDAINRAKYYQRILFKEMSLEAIGKNYSSIEYRLGKNRIHPDQEKFYRILVGELDEKGRKMA
ncbi:MAG: hypothetical protein RDU76_11145 [Candidatus Edwardsbacteria bacterium]|nr:hypothetical protein [Candidatus Edwardsbacteria bacterium]